ncbi:MAG: DUF2341 domain-containing protein, partial [Candidatus Thorarchaeota archaeon]
SGEHVYLNSKSRTDFGDIRFTDDDGSTLLDYWMESKTDGDQAVFWVEVADNLTASDATIYIYYGKSDATTTSNGTATFLLYDDFEDDEVNEMPSGWTEDESQRTGQTFVQNLVVHGGSKALRTDMEPDLASYYYYAVSPPLGNITYDVKITLYVRYELGQYSQLITGGEGGTIYQVRTNCPGAWDISYWNGGSYVDAGSYTEDTWYKMDFILKFDTKKYDWFMNDEQKASNANFVNTAGKLGTLKFGTHMNQIMYVDDIIVRKYVSPEPQHGSWGTEERNAIIDNFEAPSPINPNEYFLLNATIMAPSSVTEFINASIELEGGIILKWDNSTDSFTEYQDTNGYCTLDASGSFKTQLNSTSYKLSWRIKLSSSFPEGYTDVVDADVYTSNKHGQNSQSSVFYFTKYNNWWNTDWQKRKSINITENSGATLTNYAVAMNVTYDNDMQADFDDLRFTIYNSTIHDEVLLDYYIESESDSSWAYVWVEIPEISASSTVTIYMYYGNPSATSASNASATFILWDDFEQDREWTYSENGASFSGEYATDLYHSASTSYRISYPSGTTSSAGYYGQIAKGITFDGSQVKIEVWVRDSYAGGTSGYHVKKVKLGGTQLWSDDVAGDEGWMHVSVATTPSEGTSNLILQVYEQNGVSNFGINVWWDDVIVRKYVSPEPSATFGSEETGPAANNAPSISGFEAPSTVYAERYFWLNVTVADADGVADLDYVTVQIGTVVLKWDSSGDVFSEQSDPSGLCTLDASASTNTLLSSSSYKLSFRLKLSWSFTEGSVDVSATVYDVSAASGSGSQAGLFTFEDDVVVQGCYFSTGSEITVKGHVYYEGTSIPPMSGVTVKAEYGGSVKASTSSLTNGLFTLSWTEST